MRTAILTPAGVPVQIIGVRTESYLDRGQYRVGVLVTVRVIASGQTQDVPPGALVDQKEVAS
jgi:hypothetical protein